MPAGRGQFGVNAFLDCYTDSLLTCGRAIGEILPAAGNREIAALLCGRVENVEIREGDNPLDFTVCGPDERGRMGPLPCQELLLFTPFNPGGGQPLRRVAAAVAALSDGHPDEDLPHHRRQLGARAATCATPSPAGTARAARRRSGAASWPEEWSRAMQETRSGSVRDFVAVGDVDIQVIGADGPILDSEVPVRQILEQVVAKTGHPALYAGAELELHGADELPAGGPADHGDHRHPPDADADGGADLPAVAADARIRLRLPGGLGRHQSPGSGGGGPGGALPPAGQEAAAGERRGRGAGAWRAARRRGSGNS